MRTETAPHAVPARKEGAAVTFLLHERFHAAPKVLCSEGLLPLLGLAPLEAAIPGAAEYLSADRDDLASRADALGALLADERLTPPLTALGEALATLAAVARHTDEQPERLLESMTALRDLAAAVDAFAAAAHGAAPRFAALADTLRTLTAPLLPPDLPARWDGRASGVGNAGSVTYRVRLDDDLRVSAVALSRVDGEAYTQGSKYEIFRQLTGTGSGSSRMKRLLDRNVTAADDRPGPANLIDVTMEDARTFDFRQNLRNGRMLPQILREGADELLTSQTQAARRLLTDRARRLTAALAPLARELTFLLAALGTARRVVAEGGVFPTLADGADALRLTAARHPYLADCVPNNADIGADTIALVCGDGQSGKTTYLRALGACQVFAQLGLPVPAAVASVSPVGVLAAAFSVEERTELEHGKLGQDLENVRGAIGLIERNVLPDGLAPDDGVSLGDGHAAPDAGFAQGGLFLFNDPISGSSPEGCLNLSRELLAVLKVGGHRGVWVTQLGALAREAPAMNAALPGSALHAVEFRAGGGFRADAGAPDARGRSVP